jgi:hypothetical protein
MRATVCDFRRSARVLLLGILLSHVPETLRAQTLPAPAHRPSISGPPVLPLPELPVLPLEVEADSAFTVLPANLGIEAPTQAFPADADVAAQNERTSSVGALVTTTASAHDPEPISAEELLAAYRLCQQAADHPTRLDHLTGGYKLYQSSYRESVAASLGVIGIGDITGRRDALVVQYHFFRIVRGNCAINRVDIPVIWGVGVASTLHIREVRGGARTNSLPSIAASVEFGRASVTMRMETAGLVGASIENAFPSAQSTADFDVQAYGAWAVSLDKIRGLMSDPSVTATPQLLITEEALPAIRRAFTPR